MTFQFFYKKVRVAEGDINSDNGTYATDF